FRGIHRPRLIPNVYIDQSSEPPQDFRDTNQASDITTEIEHLIGTGAIAAPPSVDGLDFMYMVIIPNGHFLIGNSATAGSHGFATYAGNGNRYYFGWVKSDGHLNQSTSAPAFFGHEVSEAATDPEFTAFNSGQGAHGA